MAGRRHRKAPEPEEHENEERWLLTYADMITLLMCLFMVLFSISSVNTSKFEAFQRAMQDAFSGAVLSGGRAVMETASSSEQTKSPSPEPPVPALAPVQVANVMREVERGEHESSAQDEAEARREEEELQALKRRVERLAREAGLGKNVSVTVRPRGLVIRLLTDRVFFNSGQAVLKAPARPLLAKVGAIINAEAKHPVVVEGYTDSQPITTGQYRSNWSLAGGRAEAVALSFEQAGVPRRRMTNVSFAEQHPVDTNSTAAGRARNRRVEVVLTRINPMPEQTDAGRRR